MKKTVTKLLAVTVMLFVLTSVTSINANAVSISQAQTVPEIQNAIQDAINTALATPGVTTVTVTGEKTNASTILRLDVPGGVRVIWQATYRSTSNPAIDVWGQGTFEVATTTGQIQNTNSTGSVTALRVNDSIDGIVNG